MGELNLDDDPKAMIAEIRRETGPPLSAEVIGFRDEMTLLYPLSVPTGGPVRR